MLFRFKILLFAIAFVCISEPAAPAETAGGDAGCSPEEALQGLISAQKLSLFSPRARISLISAMMKKWSAADLAGINTPLRIDHFLAEIATETGGLVRLDENLDYSAERLLAVFPRRLTPPQAASVAHRPEATANLVYFHVNGNTLPTDGWTYRGSGFIQLTGRGNFEARGKQLSLPLVDRPEIARDPETGFTAATAYWSGATINPAADADDVKRVRLLVNGGVNGIADARIWLARAKRVFPPTPLLAPEEANAPSEQEIEAVKQKLEELGFLHRQRDESFAPSDFIDALKRFQSASGLPVTGAYDEDTLYALTNPVPQGLQ